MKTARFMGRLLWNAEENSRNPNPRMNGEFRMQNSEFLNNDIMAGQPLCSALDIRHWTFIRDSGFGFAFMCGDHS
jgi:hypothetical protein